MKTLFFDVETTGLKPEKNGIYQLSGSIHIEGECKERFNYQVAPNPNCKYDDEAMKMAGARGITMADMMCFPTMGEVHADFTKLLGKYCDKYDKKDKFHLVGYNNRSFDDLFLRGFFVQNGDQYFGSWFWPDSHDVLVMASVCLAKHRHMMEDFKLKTVARTFGIQIDEARLHDAMYDIELTEKVYYLIEPHGKPDQPTVELTIEQ